jgi:hypothetical protein
MKIFQIRRHKRRFLLATEPPRAKFRGIAPNFLHATDPYTSAWPELNDQNAEALVWSLFKKRLFTDTDFGNGHQHTESLELGMPWIHLAHFVITLEGGISIVGSGADQSWMYTLALIPAPFDVIYVFIKADNQQLFDSDSNVRLEFAPFNGSASFSKVINANVQDPGESVQLYPASTISHFMHAIGPIDLSGLALDADGFRRVFFRLTIPNGSNGFYGHVVFKAPKVEGKLG